MPRKKRDFTPLPGFPIREPFKCMEEVETYLSGNLIQCRECGHHFMALARHLTKQHEITADEYKETHGIPWMRGLTSGAFHSELSQQAYALDSVAKVAGKYNNKKGQKNETRGYCIARRVQRMSYTDEQYYSLAARVAAGEALLSVCREPGVPSVEAVRQYRKFNKDYDAFFRERVEPNLLPLRSAERKSLSDGRVQTAIAMAASGATAKEIAAATGYSPSNAYLFINGSNWGHIREGKKPVTHDPRPHTLKARIHRLQTEQKGVAPNVA
ncbi:MucR family transcriptional regulator [Mesorhizobium sp.]|uniref:MucR family transcriptional regulator n=1 Tax=Mesorhizobium sp. TaxID=1871066 RepID=UPI000FE9FDC5|nr:MucR family transcriptional regulator [Mesorhizobium sp.]RWG25805.1 MAG: hypothetical protein EOQ60_28865 [Mesorhizobium sp.]TIS17856.1 MAG: hypothetical protein E5X10_01925 [Mesorhizobium sp.]